MQKLRAHAVLQTIVLATMAMSAFGPPAFVFYHCDMMGSTMLAPCSDEDSTPDESEAPQLQDESCCTRVTVAVDRIPSEVAPVGVDHALAAVVPVLALAETTPAVHPPSAPALALDEGPPIILRVCSLLI